MTTESKPLITTTVPLAYFALPDQIVMGRTLRGLSLDTQTYRYTCYRHVRIALRGAPIEEIFDKLAVESPLPRIYRTGASKLLLDGDSALINLNGANKLKHSSLYMEVWAESTERVKALIAEIEAIVAPWKSNVVTFSIDWKFMSAQGMGTVQFEEELDDEIHDEAYPYWSEPRSTLIQKYLASDETVMLVLGTPGTGKTRFVRSIFREIAKKKESCNVLFTGDQKVLENEQVFAEFITGGHDVFVIEDADHLLMPRSSGNNHLHPFLTVADGIVKAQARKIIFTTNLPNINDVDEALVRPGRCFAALRTTTLDMGQAVKLIQKLLPDVDESVFIPQLNGRNTLAHIYKLCKTHTATDLG
jgi:hypothetical protein